MQSNNRGLTLVELVVVVGLMVLLFSLSALGVSAANRARQDRAPASVSVLISKTRVACLSKSGEIYLELSLDETGGLLCRYYENGRLMSTEALPLAGQTLGYTLQSVSTGETQSRSISEEPLRLSFLRSTGAQKPQGDYVCTALVFTGTKARTLTLVPSTGAQSLR